MPPPSRETPIDALILGGGIAGLWTLARLRNEGYSCLLVESKALGAGQTIASQGIIHGGVKYALTGHASAASKAIAEMPGIWRACLEGTGEIDLRAVKVLSERQYLWTTTGIGSRIAGVAASKVIRTSVEPIPPEQRPDWLSRAPRAVDVYAVDEPILDPHSLITALADQLRPHLLTARGYEWLARLNGRALQLRSASGDPIIIFPKCIVLAAGAGNAALIDELGLNSIAEKPRFVSTQLRPLHMVLARGWLPPIFGHCIGFSDKPRITITSQTDSQSRTVWYIGGDLAESGVDRSPAEQVAAARAEVAHCLPWLDLSGVQWSCFRIDRAEGILGRAKGQRPDEPLVHAAGDAILAFPTKLAFAPLLAARVADLIRAAIPPSAASAPNLDNLDRPSIAPLPWDNDRLTWT